MQDSLNHPREGENFFFQPAIQPAREEKNVNSKTHGVQHFLGTRSKCLWLAKWIYIELNRIGTAAMRLYIYINWSRQRPKMHTQTAVAAILSVSWTGEV